MEPPHPPFRVTKLHLENFKSCRSTTVDFNDFSCLVGPNNSGKTNVLEGMRFLQAVVNAGLQQALAHFGGIERIRHLAADPSEPTAITVDGRDHALQFRYRVALTAEGHLCEETLSTQAGGARREVIVTEGKLPSINIEVWDDEGGVFSHRGYTDDIMLRRAPGRTSAVDKITAHLRGLRFYRFSPDRLKAEGPAVEARTLNGDGSNFASFLHSVQSRHRRVFSRIEDQLIKSFPDVDEVVTPLIDDRTVIGVREKWFDQPVEGSNLSDGLVGFLAHLVAFYGPDSPTLLVFEEPENYIHARLMERLVEMLRESSKHTQCVITTHSVTLLNHMRPEDVRVVDRKEGSTSVRAIPTDAQLADTLSSWGLGDLYFTGELGGVPN